MDGFSLLLLFVILWLGDLALDAGIRRLGRARAAARRPAGPEPAQPGASAQDEPCPIPDQ